MTLIDYSAVTPSTVPLKLLHKMLKLRMLSPAQRQAIELAIKVFTLLHERAKSKKKLPKGAHKRVEADDINWREFCKTFDVILDLAEQGVVKLKDPGQIHGDVLDPMREVLGEAATWVGEKAVFGTTYEAWENGA